MRNLIVCAVIVFAALLASCATTQTGATAQARSEPVQPPPTEIRVEPPISAPEPSPVPPISQPGKVTEPIKDQDGTIDWGVGIIRVTGNGALDPANTNQGQELLKAERAATVDAQRKLLEITKGVRVNGETMVEDYILESDIVMTQINGIVKGARQIGVAKYDSARGTVSVELVMNLYGRDGISDAIRPEPPEPPPRKPLDAKAQALLSKYSGIVIEGAGTNGKPSLFPRLYDEKGNLILDTRELIGRDARYGQGTIQFVDNVNEVLSNPELARNPLVIKVKQFQGKYLSDYVIPTEQADILKTLKDVAGFLLKAGRFLITLL
jgi:hypothetical protein